MAKSGKKSAAEVNDAPAVTPSSKSAKKGKREAEEAIKKIVSAKKQKRGQEIKQAVPVKKPEVKTQKKKKKRESSSSDDSSSEEDEKVTVVTKTAAKPPVGESSSDESTSDEGAPKTKAPVKNAPTQKGKKAPAKEVTHSKKQAAGLNNGSAVNPAKKVKAESSSSDSSDEDEKPSAKAALPVTKQVNVKNGPVKKAKAKAERRSDSSSDDDSSSDEDDVSTNFLHPRRDLTPVSPCQRIRALEDAILALAARSLNNQSVFDRFDRHRPPTYDGTPDPVVLEGWLREMEKLFDATGCPMAEKVAIGTYYLKKEADNWWSMAKAECTTNVGFGWEQFSAKLKERFYPEELRWQKREEFLKLSQGSMSVQQYTDKFTELYRFATTVIPNEAEKVRFYVERMDPRIRTYVLCSDAATFQGAYEVALSVYASVQEEEAARHALLAKRPLTSFFAPDSPKKLKFFPTKKGDSTSGFGSRKCFKCQKDWHSGKACDGSVIRCFHCNEEGHRSYVCFKNPTVTKAKLSASGGAPIRNRIYNMIETEEEEFDE